jgi:hypothetical protein
MPADASAAEAVLSRQRRIGLRVALAVGALTSLARGAEMEARVLDLAQVGTEDALELPGESIQNRGMLGG